MFHFCENNNGSSTTLDAAHEFYKGKHSSKYSLQELATLDRFKSGLTFAFQIYGLIGKDLDLVIDSGKYTSFADRYINSLLLDTTPRSTDADVAQDDAPAPWNESKCKKASTAAVWHVLFMQANYELWGGMVDCSISGDPNFNNEAAGIGDHNAKADEFIAYWVGSLNDSLSSKDGYSPFSATNEVGEYFNTLQFGGLAYANKNILMGYESLSALLSDDRSCDEDTVQSTLDSMWIINNQITPYMMVPLIQNLIRAMIQEDQAMIDVYAHMVVPQMSQCRHSQHKYLKEHLIDLEYDHRKLHSLIKVLQDSYGCFGLTCEDIGRPKEHTNDSLLWCSSADYEKPNLAGYPATTDVREESQMDLDVHQMNILMSFDNDHYWDMAKRIYLSGKNSKAAKFYDDTDDDSFLSIELNTLHSLARSNKRQGTLFYDEMLNYNLDNPYYADMLIVDIFNKDSMYDSETKVVRKAIISDTIITQIMYPHILAEMQDAVGHCVNGNKFDYQKVTLAWDHVAAYIIGSLEGSKRGGSGDFSDGNFLLSLANKRGIEFNRLNEDGYAVVNNALENLLLSGKGQIVHLNCHNLERTSQMIAHILLIPMIQSVVKYALSNQFLAYSSDDVTIFQGEVFAKFLIPIYAKFSRKSANTLQHNMIRNHDVLVADGPQAVADAYLAIADDIGVQCEYIGKSYEVDACLNYVPELKIGQGEIATSDASSAMFNWKIGGALASLVVMYLL
jgi:hypothetical protein